MADRTTILRWPSDRAEPELATSSEARLEALLEDRVSGAQALVVEASEALLERLHAADGPAWRDELPHWLAALDRVHGWRAPMARWLVALSSLLDAERAEPAGAGLRALLAEELGLWLGGEDGEAPGPWSGLPLASGVRLPDPRGCAEGLAPRCAPGEVVVVHGHGDTVGAVLIELAARGLPLRVVASEGAGDLAGRRLAGRLAEAGLAVRLTFDLALLGELSRADHLWLGTEAVGARALLARRGARALLEEAERLEVPAAVLATADQLAPGGELRLPEWCAREGWLLWESAPAEVELDAQLHEEVPLELVPAFHTEVGRESAAELALRALQTGAPGVTDVTGAGAPPSHRGLDR